MPYSSQAKDIAMLSSDETHALIEAVRVAAKAEILPRFRNLDATDIAQKSTPDDLVTIADQAAEVAISASVAEVLPGCAIVGEEAVAEDATLLDQIGGAARCAIIDPIDGTANFVAGLATFGVILAVVEDGKTEFGLLYDPLADDWVMGRAGQGAFYAKPGAAPRRLQTRTVRQEEADGFLSPRLYAREDRAALYDAYTGFNYARSIGCSCHDYRVLAFGRADFISSPMMNPWDHAAGVLILQEAGGAALVAGQHAYAPHMTKGPIAASGTPALLPAIAAAEAAGPRSRLG